MEAGAHKREAAPLAELGELPGLAQAVTSIEHLVRSMMHQQQLHQQQRPTMPPYPI